MRPYILIQSTTAPYSNSSSVDAYEAALAASNLGLLVKFVFVGDGVFQLMPNQSPVKISHKNMFKKLNALPLFDVEDLYVVTADIEDRNCILSDDSELQLTQISASELVDLCTHAQHILVF